MIRVNILSSGTKTNELDFDTQELADAYIVDVSTSKHWGEDATFTTEDVTVEVTLKARVKSLIESGLSDADACNNCLALVGGYNKERAYSTAQIQAMASAFTNIDYCLSKKMPKSAKVLISAITPDEAVVTTELKNLLLEVLKEY